MKRLTPEQRFQIVKFYLLISRNGFLKLPFQIVRCNPIRLFSFGIYKVHYVDKSETFKCWEYPIQQAIGEIRSQLLRKLGIQLALSMRLPRRPHDRNQIQINDFRVWKYTQPLGIKMIILLIDYDPIFFQRSVYYLIPRIYLHFHPSYKISLQRQA